jgi:SagB-type dehydrogenase family enzyme
VNWDPIESKEYPRLRRRRLPPLPARSRRLGELLRARRSDRELAGELTLTEVGAVVSLSLGIQGGRPAAFPRRSYPSAGYRYPVEAYLVASRVRGLAPGVYHFNVRRGDLEVLLTADMSGEIAAILRGQDPSFFRDVSALLLLSAVPARSGRKYGMDAAHRFSLLECGHIGQNVYLASAALGIGCCAIGGVDEGRTAALLDLPEEEIPLYALALGKSPV